MAKTQTYATQDWVDSQHVRKDSVNYDQNSSTLTIGDVEVPVGGSGGSSSSVNNGDLSQLSTDLDEFSDAATTVLKALINNQFGFSTNSTNDFDSGDWFEIIANPNIVAASAKAGSSYHGVSQNTEKLLDPDMSRYYQNYAYIGRIKEHVVEKLKNGLSSINQIAECIKKYNFTMDDFFNQHEQKVMNDLTFNSDGQQFVRIEKTSTVSENGVQTNCRVVADPEALKAYIHEIQPNVNDPSSISVDTISEDEATYNQVPVSIEATKIDDNTTYKITVNPVALTEQQFADLLDDDEEEDSAFIQHVKKVANGTAQIFTSTADFVTGFVDNVFSSSKSRNLRKSNDNDNDNNDDSTLEVKAEKTDGDKIKLTVPKPEIKVVGTDGSEATISSGTITFESAEDSNVQVNVKKDGDNIKVTIGVYYT